MNRQLLAVLVLCLAAGTLVLARKGGKHGFRAPFLKGLDAAKQSEYQKIVQNEQLTKKQFREAVDQFAAGLPEANKKIYDDWKAKHTGKKGETFEAKIAKLSPAAQELARKMKAVQDNLDITRAEERKEIHNLKSAAPKAVQKELRGIFAHGRHHGVGPARKQGTEKLKN